MTARKTATIKKARPAPKRAVAVEVRSALASLERKSTKRDRDNLKRFGITAERFLGVSMSNMKALAKELGRSHELADALWKTGIYEARMLATLVDEPERVTPAQMDRWCRDFDNWAICDTACFCLFDRTPHAWGRVKAWSRRRDEFQKRAAFALLACLAAHDKGTGDKPFLDGLRLVEAAAYDDRNFVKKGVSWALRGIGRRNRALRPTAVKLARRLADSQVPASRWIGKDALRDFAKLR